MKEWASTNNQVDIINWKDEWKSLVKKTKITRNKYGVYILWIDEESAQKYNYSK